MHGRRWGPTLVPVVAAGLLGAYWLPGTRGIRRVLRPVLGVRERLSTPDGVALTFDDGPHPEGTPAVLALLDGAGVRATFFLVGAETEKRPELAAEIVAAGHEVALHCHGHVSELRRTPWQLREDLRRGAATVAEASGREPRLYRPPYGVFSAGGLILARSYGWEPMDWSLPSFDWEPSQTAASIAANVTGNLSGGDIVLLHDSDAYCYPGSWRRTVAALPHLLEAMTDRGLQAAVP